MTTATQKPNVIIVICDDLGYGDLGCNGGDVIRTPRIDSLADDGVRATAAYSGGPTCSPSRAALLTGRVAPRTGVGRVTFPDEDRGLYHGERTIASYLREEGYVTGCFGKWHVGQFPERSPLRFGFDEYFGLPFSNDTPPYNLYDREEIIDSSPDMPSLTRRYVERTIDFIDRAESTPFFAYVAFNTPHYPLEPEEEFLGRSRAGLYGDTVESIDHHVGVLVDALESRGLLDDTLLVFTSDHGPWFEGSTGDRRGRKFETWDGGTHVPLILSWPRQLDARVVRTPVTTMDLLPTICDYLGLPVNEDRPFDGESIRGVIEGRHSTHGPIWYFDGYALDAVRLGRWKFHQRRQTWGAERFGQMSLPQLFDLEADPGESYDVSNLHSAVVSDLAARLNNFAETIDSSDDDQREWWRVGDVEAR